MHKPSDGLTPLYLSALNHPYSFIKSINPGTGLGKTYSAFEAINTYITTQTDQSPHVFIYTAPQHNQIVINHNTREKLESNGCTVINVLPVSEVALSNIDSAMNAYQIAKDLFYTSTGKQNTLFKALSSITKKLDAQHIKKPNVIALNKRLTEIAMLTMLVDAEQKRYFSPTTKAKNPEQTEEQQEVDADDKLRQMMQASIHEFNQQEEAERSAQRIEKALGAISRHLTKLCEYSYSNDYFYQAIETSQILKPPSRKKWRTITASFYPFLHIQKSGCRYSLLTMTVAKMMTRHKFLCPKNKKGVITWSNRDAAINDIATDNSALISQAKELLKNTPTSLLGTYSNAVPFFNSQFIFFIDESDAAKSVMANNLCSELEDKGVIQAIGAFAKEVIDVVGNDNHLFLMRRIKQSQAPTLLDAVNELHNDDALARIVAKENILQIRKKIYEVLLNNDWIFARDGETVKSLFEKTNTVFKGSLTAPYCTVMQSIDSEVFKSTSVFGGEMYGFTGSKKINNLTLVNMGNSFSIMAKEAANRLPTTYERIPLAYFFLLLTEVFLYFRLISKDRGSEQLDEEHAQEFNAFLASNEAIPFLKHIDTFYKKKTGALSGIGAPFRNHYQHESQINSNTLHTKAAEGTLMKIKTMITQEQFQQAFSDNKDLIQLVDDEIHTFSAPQAFPIDLHFANHKGHTIYGMAQVHDTRYPINHNRRHVVFPLMFRAQSPEQFIVNLVHTKQRKNGVFLMSATGGFKANHISAFSLETLTYLLEIQSIPAQRLTMNAEEYAYVEERQKKRKAQKILIIKHIDQALPPLSVQTDLYWNGSHLNQYKKSEINNIAKALNHVHAQTKPYFALALAQTHRHFTRHLFNLSQCNQAATHSNSDQMLQHVECLLSSNTTHINHETTSGEASYAIFLAHNTHSPNTLVVCYAAALEKVLEQLLRSQDKNPFKAENRLKKALGFALGEVPKFADDPSTNPMDYLLSDAHGHHVLIVSAYQSAARGINLIVNNQSSSLLHQKRDLDALFVCAVPYYSELNTNITPDSLHPTVAQRYFFHRCKKYFYRIEELARRAHKEGETKYSSEDIDLFIADNDPINTYFLEQHHIALMSILMQGVGRIERTDAHQTQYLYLSADVDQIIKDGMQAVRKDLNHMEKVQMSKGLSMVNSALFDHVLDFNTENEEQTKQHIDEYHSFAEHFEKIKNQLLDYCSQYRTTENEAIYVSITPFIYFYETFRSKRLWTEGRAAYLTQLHQAIKKLPTALQPEYTTFVNQLYINKAKISVEDLDALYAKKSQAKVNAYYDYDPITKKSYYAAPWFLADMGGNYGEMVVKEAIKQLNVSGVKRLHPALKVKARRCYEIADYFLQLGDQVLALDAKHYGHLGAFYAKAAYQKRPESMSRPKNKLRAIQEVFDVHSKCRPTRLALINVYATERHSAGFKHLTDRAGNTIQHAYAIAAGDDPRSIAVQILQLLQS